MNKSTTSSAIISARDLGKSFEQGRVRAVDHVSLDISEGEFVAICGPSGCGKTTLLNLLAAMDQPDHGSLVVCGRNVASLDGPAADQYRRSIVGMVFQLHNLMPNLTASENVQIPLMVTERNSHRRIARAAELLDHVSLSDRSHALATTLSGGERQRVAIARALANRPRILLADEPTGAIDSASGDRLMKTFQQIREDSATTVVVVTHDDRVASRADRIIHMLDGAVVNGGMDGENAAHDTP